MKHAYLIDVAIAFNNLYIVLEGPTSITSIRRTSLGIPGFTSTVEYGAVPTLISTIGLQNSGFHSLYEMPSVHIEQTLELNESV